MNDTNKLRDRAARWAGPAALLAAGAIAGGILAGSLSANAATNTPAPSSGYSATARQEQGGFPAHGTAAHEAMEKAVTGANASKAQAAAVKAVGGGTAGAVTTDMSGNGYETTVTKSDGSKVEVHLDQSYNIDDHGRIGG